MLDRAKKENAYRKETWFGTSLAKTFSGPGLKKMGTGGSPVTGHLNQLAVDRESSKHKKHQGRGRNEGSAPPISRHDLSEKTSTIGKGGLRSEDWPIAALPSKSRRNMPAGDQTQVDDEFS